MATSMFHRIFFYTQKLYLGGIILICLMSSAPAIAKQWAPKYVNGVFSEIAKPWVAPASGTSGAPRHGWLNTFDGFFTKEWHASYTFARNLNQSGRRDQYVGTFRLQLPLSSRAWVGLTLPTAHTRNTSNLGDISITLKLMLHETRDVSISAGVGVQLPTGKRTAGGGTLSVLPHLALWTDIGNNWSLRGGVGIKLYPENNTRPDEALVLNLSIGHTFTAHNMAPFGDFTLYLAGNLREPLSGASTMGTFTSLTPGMRTYLGKDIYFLAGVEVPTSGPKLFEEQYFGLMVFAL